MKREIYVLGSINIDVMISANRMPQQGETIAGYDYFEAIGGKGGNQATAAAKLGACVHLIGSVGRDYHGQLALKHLSDAGIDATHVAISDAEHTGTAVIIKTEQDNRIIINQGANANFKEGRVGQCIMGSAHDFFLTQFEVPLYAVYEGLQTARQKGLTTLVNPAPAVIMDDAFYPLIDYLIVNQSESETLSGVFPTDVASCLKASEFFLAKGVKHVIYTLGGDGSILVNAQDTIITASYNVDVVDTTGAGDSFIGTFLYCLAHDFSLAKALGYASAGGALACTKAGAQEGLSDLVALEAFIKKKETY